MSKAFRRRQSLARQLDAVRETVELSESTLESILASWEYGRVSVMDVFASHIALTERRIRLHRLESELAVAAAELQWSIGGSP